MDWQTIAQGLFLIVSGITGWFVRELWEVVKELKKDMKTLEVKFAEECVSKEELSHVEDKFTKSVDRVNDSLDWIKNYLLEKKDK